MGAGVGLITAALSSSKRHGRTDQKKNSIDLVSEHEHISFSHHRQPSHPTTVGSGPGALGSNQAGYPYSIRPVTYGSTRTNSSSDGVFTSRLFSSPERLRRDSQILLNRVPEDGTMEFEHDEGPSYLGGTPLDRSEEDEERELDERLMEQGLYRGSYARLMALYTLAPLTWIITFTLLALLPAFVYPVDRSLPPSPYPYAPYLPFPTPEFLVAVVLWSFAYLLRDPIYAYITAIFSLFPSLPIAIPISISTAIHTLVSTFFLLCTFPLLLIPQNHATSHPTAWDPAFRRVWWVALGWSAAEAVVGTKQGYESISLYRDILVSVRRTVEDSPTDAPGSASSTCDSSLNFAPRASTETRDSAIDLLHRGLEDEVYGQQGHYDDGERESLLPRTQSQTQAFELEDALKKQVEHDIDQLVTLKAREDLEEAYGMPVIRIPVFISCLQRVNSVLLSLGVSLLLSSAYLSSTIASASLPFGVHTDPDITRTNTPLIVTLALVLLVQFFLGLLHTPLVLPWVGVHTVVYAGAMVSLGSFFGGLAVWEALS